MQCVSAASPSRVSTAREIVGGLDGPWRVRRIPGETRASSLPPRRGAGGANVGSIIRAQGFEEGRRRRRRYRGDDDSLARCRAKHKRRCWLFCLPTLPGSSPSRSDRRPRINEPCAALDLTALPQRPSGWRKLSHLWAPNSYSIPAAEDERINSRVVAGSSVS